MQLNFNTWILSFRQMKFDQKYMTKNYKLCWEFMVWLRTVRKALRSVRCPAKYDDSRSPPHNPALSDQVLFFSSLPWLRHQAEFLPCLDSLWTKYFDRFKIMSHCSACLKGTRPELQAAWHSKWTHTPLYLAIHVDKIPIRRYFVSMFKVVLILTGHIFYVQGTSNIGVPITRQITKY